MSKKLRVIVLAVAVLTTWAVAQSAKPYALQSDRLGMTWSEWISAHGYTPADAGKKGVCKPALPARQRQRCKNAAPQMKIAGCDVYSIEYSFYQDRLYEITVLLPQRCFARVRKAFSTIYGPEAGTSPQHIQATGDRLLEGIIVFWGNDVSGIQFSRYDTSPDQSEIYFLHSELGKEATKYSRDNHYQR